MKSNKAGKKSTGFFVYIVRCTDGTYYCGYTKNLQQRIEMHNNGRGAKYTRARRPVTLAYYEKKKTILQAMRREREIKSLSRRHKEGLILHGKSPKDRPT